MTLLVHAALRIFMFLLLCCSKGAVSCRYHSLCAYMGDDDMFSSDLTDDQLRMRLGHMSNTPCQVGICLISFSNLLNGLFANTNGTLFQDVWTWENINLNENCK